MKYLCFIFLMINSILSLLASAYFMHQEKNGWGWFLFTSILFFLFSTGYLYSVEEMKEESTREMGDC